MALVDDADIQIHLPIDKIRVEDIPDDLDKAKEDAERVIRGYLAGAIDAAIIATWITPALTPGEIRGIAGRLAAALIYRTRFSEQSLDDPEYAQNKYTEAMMMLQDIIAGNLILEDIDVGTDFDNTYFFPNAGATDQPKFTMGARW